MTTTTTTTRRMTPDELWALPEEERGELIEGEFFPVPPVDMDHSDPVGSLVERLRQWARAHDGGKVCVEVGFRMPRPADTVLGPDVAYIRREKVPPPGQRSGFKELVPDVAVEVRSPSNTAALIARKVGIYLDNGVRLVLVVEPRQKSVTVHLSDQPPRTLSAEDVLEGGDTLPGFALPVAALFED